VHLHHSIEGSLGCGPVSIKKTRRKIESGLLVGLLIPPAADESPELEKDREDLTPKQWGRNESSTAHSS
jgi:hypothetical protein